MDRHFDVVANWTYFSWGEEMCISLICLAFQANRFAKHAIHFTLFRSFHNVIIIEANDWTKSNNNRIEENIEWAFALQYSWTINNFITENVLGVVALWQQECISLYFLVFHLYAWMLLFFPLRLIWKADTVPFHFNPFDSNEMTLSRLTWILDIITYSVGAAYTHTQIQMYICIYDRYRTWPWNTIQTTNYSFDIQTERKWKSIDQNLKLINEIRCARRKVRSNNRRMILLRSNQTIHTRACTHMCFSRILNLSKL